MITYRHGNCFLVGGKEDILIARKSSEYVELDRHTGIGFNIEAQGL